MATPEFHRLVLAVAHGEAGPALLGRAAEAARLLRLALHCVLIEDETLAQLSALPFVRELRLPTHDWRPLDPARLAGEFAAAEASLRRTLEGLAARLGIAQALEVQRGDPELCFGGLCAAGDIVVLAEGPPQGPRLHPTARLHAAALRSAAAVLLLPAAPAPGAAPVAALLAGPDDPSLAVAARIAATAGVGLVAVLADGGAEAVVQRVARLGIPPERLAIRHAAGRDLAGIDAALGATREGLLVLDPAAWNGRPEGRLPEALSRARGTPVLML